MTAILEVLLDITLGSLLTAGVIILLRILFRNILSAKAKYYMWLLLALRLCLPILPESPTSLMNLFPEKTETRQLALVDTASESAPSAEDTSTEIEPVYTYIDPLDSPALEITTDHQSNPDTGVDITSGYALSWNTLLLFVWLIGIAVTLLVYAVLYGLTARSLKKLPICTDPDTLRTFVSLRKALGIGKEIRLVSGSGGMSGGLFRPTIVIPAEQHGQDLSPILLHELIHIRVNDLWLMAFYRILCAINWFNPVVWLCFHRAKLDSEAACDQRVLETGLVERTIYAETLYREGLLHSADGLYFRTTFGGKNHAIRDRIRQIARFAGKKKWMVPLVLVIALVITSCTLTSRTEKQNSTVQIGTSAVQLGDSIYYTDSLSGTMRQLNLSTMETTVLFENFYSSYMVASEDEIWILGETALLRFDPDTTELTTEYECENSTTQLLALIDGNVIFEESTDTEDYRLWCRDTAGNITCIKEQGRIIHGFNLTALDGTLYFSEAGSPGMSYSMELNEGSQPVLLDETHWFGTVAVGNDVYCAKYADGSDSKRVYSVLSGEDIDPTGQYASLSTEGVHDGVLYLTGANRGYGQSLLKYENGQLSVVMKSISNIWYSDVQSSFVYLDAGIFFQCNQNLADPDSSEPNHTYSLLLRYDTGDIQWLESVPTKQSIGETSEHTAALPAIADSSETCLDNIPWDVTPEGIMELLNLDSDNSILSENSTGTTITALSPLPEYPAIIKIEFLFQHVDSIPTLRGVNIQYDREMISYDELVALRSEALGSPSDKKEQQAEWFDMEYTTLVVNDEYPLNEYVRKVGPLSLDTSENVTAGEPVSAFPFSPASTLDGDLTFKSCPWGITPEEVMNNLGLAPEACKLTNNGKNYTLTVENPIPEHPEILKIEFIFHFIDFDLTLGLDQAEVRYDKDMISCLELIEDRSMQLGEPTSTDKSSAIWENYEGAWLTIAEGNYLTETIVAKEREFSEETITNFDLEEYVSTLHPPGGHYGWTFEEHVENGLLSPDSGVYTDYGNGEAIFFTTIELGGETVATQYCFTQSYLTYGTNAPLVLREMLVELPEDVWLSKWIERFSDSFTDKLFESTEMTYKTPIAVGSLLTEAQQDAIMEASFAQTGNGANTGGWALIFNWYDSINRIWRFNGTGYTLYLDAMTLK